MSIATGLRISLLLLLNVVIGTSIFYLLGAQFSKIGFHADDYGLIRHGTPASFGDIKRIFQHGDIMHSSCFSSENLYPYGKPSCLEVIYRPLLLLIMGTEVKIFGVNPYATHLIHIALHTLIALALFNLLIYFFSSIPLAVLGSLFFGFHSALKDYFFWQCYIQNSLEGIFLLLLCLFLSLFLKTSQKRWSISSSIIFFLSLLLRETLVVWPLIAIIGWGIYKKINSSACKILEFLRRYILPLLIAAVSYLSLRCWAYPLTSAIKRIGIKSLQGESSSFTFLRDKFFDLLTYYFDLCGMKWIPAGHTLLKGAIFLSTIIALAFFWIKSNKLQKLSFCALISILLLLSWPALLFFHSSRYLYLPCFFLAILLVLVIQTICRKSFSKIFTYSFLALFVTLQSYITIKTMGIWCAYNYKEMLIHQELGKISHTTTKPILVLGTPIGIIGTGACSGPVVVGAKKYSTYTYQLSPRSAIGNYLTIDRLFHALFTDSSLQISSLIFRPIKNRLEIEAPQPQNLWFEKDIVTSGAPMGQIEILKEKDNKITHFRINIDPDLIKNTLILGWLHEQGKFIPLN